MSNSAPDQAASDQPQWVFGYGSLIWRPDMQYLAASPAYIRHFERRFWQGSHDHRGTPDAPGRVVTLIPREGASCVGMAYLIDAHIVAATFEALDHREKNGYLREAVDVYLESGKTVSGSVYIAAQDNFAYLGDAPLQEIARQIVRSEGPSGRNIDYLNDLVFALQSMGAYDEHVFELAHIAQQEGQ